MTDPRFQRLGLLAGPDTMKVLARCKVIIFGIGGVGSWCAEGLVRSGLGALDIVDSDAVCITNINRQIQATETTVGLLKTDALRERLLTINSGCAVRALGKVFSRKNAGDFDIPGADYVIDAIDSLTHKLDLIETACKAGVPVFSSMGMAQKLDPARLRTADIWETSGCPLARLVRQGLRKRGFTGHFTVVYSNERTLPRREAGAVCGAGRCLCPARNADDPAAPVEWCSSKKVINGSAVTVTAAAGMVLASLVLRDLYRRYGGDNGTAPRPETAG
ncbi:MAG: tRNA threonylcarbamoyladenosine dehydratase [Treponema sp.]|jgi:tRNA A37 threonylcarbamoyladenosine dehydratase|nr:tRNA threonylcarbamoyladenosine dehydratase [Treponema sp.]